VFLGEFIGFNHNEVSLLDADALQPKWLNARLITAYELLQSKGSAA
jgi:hypothetical protein